MSLAACLNDCMHDPLVDALRRLIASTEGGRHAVASAIHANEQSLYQIVSGIPLSSGKPRGVGRDLRDRLTRAFPNWLDTPVVNSGEREPPPYGGRLEINPVAHPMSPEDFDTPPTVNWGEVMSGLKLPSSFVLELGDDAISARYQKGTKVVFEAGRPPKVGRPVLVADRLGNRYVRLYGEVKGNAWKALSTDPMYASLDSQADALQIIAAAAWIEA